MIKPKEHPLICTPQSVAGILARIKTQTRRVITVPWHKGKRVLPYEPYYVESDGHLLFMDEYGDYHPMEEYRCPYGKPGSYLWIKEPWRVLGWDEDFSGALVGYRIGVRRWCDFPEPDYWRGQHDDHWVEWLVRETERIADLPGVAENPDTGYYEWKGDDVIPWKSPIFMPRWASRATVKHVKVRVQRVQDISEEDAKAEGVTPDPDSIPVYGPYKDAFRSVWDEINCKRGYGWDTNPWVRVLGFEPLPDETQTNE